MRQLSARAALVLAALLGAACSNAGSSPDVVLATMDIIAGPEGMSVEYGAADGTLGDQGPLRIRVYSPRAMSGRPKPTATKINR